MNKIWTKVKAIGAGILAAVAGVFIFLFKIKSDKLKESEKENQRKDDEIEKLEETVNQQAEKDKKYVEQKQENETLMADAISGNDDAAIQLLHNAAAKGSQRNKH